jgi:hypothetical protein
MGTAIVTSDEALQQMHAAGWSIGERGTAAGWIVDGTHGANALRAEGASQSDA